MSNPLLAVNLDVTPGTLFDPLIRAISSGLPKIPEIVASILVG